eukprot:TRINITY_DN65492_c0_g1_i1.p1 TRINITY_DN65492_c0_g1~~TRINITY_DN65492_c0_g1_i1.p1  ORF type:complete len:932 (+),score=350.74 TRINITY_DN65492_c0_g1_i1:100-2895(+)
MSLRLLQKTCPESSTSASGGSNLGTAGRGAGRGRWTGRRANTSDLGGGYSGDADAAEGGYPALGEMSVAPAAEASSSSRPARLGRSTTTPMPGSAPDGDQLEAQLSGISGLAGLLREATLLKTHGQAAAAWCEEQGASCLEEIAESLEEFIGALSLKPLQRKRLEKAFETALGACGAEEEEATAEDQAVPEPEGLRDMFAAVKLARFADAACEWCQQQGVRNCIQVHQRVEEVAEHMQVKPLEKKRLLTALQDRFPLPEAGAEEFADADEDPGPPEAPQEAPKAMSRKEREKAERKAELEQEAMEEAARREKERRLDAEAAAAKQSAKEEAAAEKAEADRRAKEDAELKAEEERRARQAEEERQARLEAERLEAERLAKEEAERAEAERIAEEGRRKAEAEAEAARKAEEARLAAERAEAERQAREEEERRQTEAFEAVEAALKRQAWDELRSALNDAEAVGVPAEALVVGREALEEQEAAAAEAANESAEALSELHAAMESKDTTWLNAAMKKAEQAGVDKEEVAAAKRVVFQLQKEKREQAKRDKSKQEAKAALEAAIDSGDVATLEGALEKAKGVSVEAAELEEAQSILEEWKAEEKRKVVQQALDDVAYSISKGDVESATLALEEAMAEGATPEDIEAAEKSLSELREQLDPEGEARRRRVEQRRQKESGSGGKKWNFSGKSSNPLIKVNDRFREHEAELEQRRMLAYRGRGKFRVEDDEAGEEAAEKQIRKQRAEVAKERGHVALPELAKAGPQKGFVWGRAAKEETEAPRRLTLKAHREVGAGIDLHASWWGMLVEAIDDEPGQPGLRLKDTITSVNGTSLQELAEEDCEQRFADLFGDGAAVTVEPYVEANGFLTANGDLDKGSLQADLERFAADWGVELAFTEANSNAASLRITMEGAQSAIKAAKTELEGLMAFYASGGAPS